MEERRRGARLEKLTPSAYVKVPGRIAKSEAAQNLVVVGNLCVADRWGSALAEFRLLGDPR